MDLMKILDSLKGVGLGNVVIIGVVLLSLVQIAPIKIDPWSRFFKWIGKLVNNDVMEEVKSIKEDLGNIHKELDETNDREERREANNTRNRILRFDDELRRKIDHSEEFFTQILDDVTFYRTYCDGHKSYPNDKADSAMQNIREVYDKCKKENKFI